MTTTTARPARAAAGSRTTTALRAVATAHGVAIFFQPVAAGLLLSGLYEALGWHATGADVVYYLGILQLAIAAASWCRTGVRWPTYAAALLVAGETGQYVAGSNGALGLHLPLGVALVAGSVGYVVAVWGLR